MNSTKLSIATTLAAALIASPATAYAESVPSPDEVTTAHRAGLAEWALDDHPSDRSQPNRRIGLG
jgi:hypothetical protein